MTIDYRLTVKCQDCYAVIRIQDERPEWRTWEPDPKEIRKAKRWLKADPDTRGPKPAYVARLWFEPEHLSIPSSYKYVVCPACDGEALPIDAADDEPAAEQAAS